MAEESGVVRVDKWLWAARFFKTRALASEAVSGGKVHINGKRVKPAHRLRVGDDLRIQRGGIEFAVAVLAVSERRGPAPEARQLYAESDDSIRRREAEAAARKDRTASAPSPQRRPSKRERRALSRLRRS